jgi:hypothetical protein
MKGKRTAAASRPNRNLNSEKDTVVTQETLEAPGIDFALVLDALESNEGDDTVVTTRMREAYIADEAAVLADRNHDFVPVRANHSIHAALSGARALKASANRDA